MGAAQRDPAVVVDKLIEFDGVDRRHKNVFTRKLQTNNFSSFVYLPKCIEPMLDLEPGDSVDIKITDDGILIVPNGGD